MGSRVVACERIQPARGRRHVEDGLVREEQGHALGLRLRGGGSIGRLGDEVGRRGERFGGLSPRRVERRGVVERAGDVTRFSAAEHDLADELAEGAFVGSGDDDANAAAREHERDRLERGARGAVQDDDVAACGRKSHRQHHTQLWGPPQALPCYGKVVAESEAKRTGRRWRNAVIGALVVVASAFVLSTAWQIIAAVFDVDPKPLVAGTADEDCAHRLRALEAALDRGSAAATHAKDEAAADKAFAAELLPEWSLIDEAETTCGREPNGTAAFTALLQLRKGLEGRARHDVAETGALRRALHERLP